MIFKVFEEIKIGDFYTLEKKITKSDIDKFIDMTGDVNPLHVDPIYANKTPYKKIVVHGMLGASFISTIIGTKLPGPGSVWLSQNFNFLIPVRLNDTLTIVCTVAKIYSKERLLEIDTIIYNQNHKKVLSGSGVVKLLKEIEKVKTSETNSRLKKVAIVTGGTGGIGSEICRKLVSLNYKVVFTYNTSEDYAYALLQEFNKSDSKTAYAVKADLNNINDLRKLFDITLAQYNNISLLVNNASSSIVSKSLLDLDWIDIEEHMSVQVKSSLFLSKLCLPKMIENKWGRIINITSQVVKDEPTFGWCAYAIAKVSLGQLTKQLAQEFGCYGVTVNSIAPGLCNTTLIQDISEKIQLITARQTPIRRLANVDDISNALEFLISETSGFITGQTLNINGGKVMY